MSRLFGHNGIDYACPSESPCERLVPSVTLGPVPSSLTTAARMAGESTTLLNSVFTGPGASAAPSVKRTSNSYGLTRGESAETCEQDYQNPISILPDKYRYYSVKIVIRIYS